MPISIAQNIVRALGGHRAGAGWMAHCPAHEDSTPSLSITESRDGKLLVHCHAGCSQAAVIAILRERGLWQMCALGDTRVDRSASARPSAADGQGAKQRIARALLAWCEARPAAGTIVETYLQARGITISPPRTLRLHPGLRHRTGSEWPAMVGLVTVGAANTPVGIHRTWLVRGGSGKAPIAPNKMMLGPCRGGAVRLAPASEPLMVGEGIETCLAAMQATGHAAWAALSTSGMRAVELPGAIRDIIVLADGDPPGEAAALDAASRWRAEGRRVRIARPPHGTDLNDVLVSRDVSTAENQR